MCTVKAIGDIAQADFLNGSVLIETDLKLENVKISLKKIEKQLGRKHTEAKFNPRIIDLDVITWNGKIIDQDFYQRDFLKQTTIQLIPNLAY